jgi:hypothetical protein
LGSVFAVGLRVNTFATVINVQALAAFQAETGFVLPADRDRLPIRVSSTLHFFLSQFNDTRKAPFRSKNYPFISLGLWENGFSEIRFFLARPG